MNKWAILSGIEANLAAYEAVIADIKRQGNKVEALYILGDLVGPRPEAEKLVERVLNPRQGELEPLICKGLSSVNRLEGFIHKLFADFTFCYIVINFPAHLLIPILCEVA